MSFNFYCTSLRVTWAIAVAAVLFCAAPVQARDWHADLPQAKVVGQGELHWFGLSIYSATLWSESKPFNLAAPFALELTYHRSISGARFVRTSIEEMRRLSDQTVSADKLQRWEALMSRAFPNVQDGDQLIGIFIPQQGCRFYDATKLLVEIDDPEFARAFFAIWFDPRSQDSSLRANLMGIR